MAQAGASPPQFMRSNTRQTALATGGRHDRPDNFWTESVWHNSADLVDRAEHWSGSHGRSGQPGLNGGPDPIQNRNGSDVAAFPDEISKHSVLLSALEVANADGCKFGTAKPTTQ
jgi:hypothetical protein